MRTKFYLYGKQIAKKDMIKKIGKERLDKMVREADEGFLEDPLEEQSFLIGGSAGILTIEFTGSSSRP